MSRTILVPLLATLLLSSFLFPIRSGASESDGSKLSDAVLEAMAPGGDVPLLIEAFSQPYTSITDDILRLGGRVTFEYKYVTALAASVPAHKIEFLAENPNVKGISLDVMVGLPEESLEGRDDALYTGLSEEESSPVSFTPEDLLAREDIDLDGDVDIIDASILGYAFEAAPGDARWNARADIDQDGDVDIVDASYLAFRFEARLSIEPSNYINPAISGVTPPVLAASGFGENTILGIIDTGINTKHFLLKRAGMVFGGIDMSCDSVLPPDPLPPLLGFCSKDRRRFPGFDRPENHFHGSFVASVAAGSGAACFSATGLLVKSIELYTGTLLSKGPCPAGSKLVALSGIAPKAQLYIVKVFDSTGRGITTSLVIAGFEHLIDKKLAGLDIDVVNVSIGGASLFDGRTLADKVADAATAAGLTMVIAAGNDGPAPMTVARAGTANTAVTVGAAVVSTHARVFRDNQLGVLGIGGKLHVSGQTQIVDFSSRGPTSDGRAKPDLVAAGSTLLAAFATNSSTGLAFASGTSFSTPGVAGAVALLNSFAEKNSLATSPFDYKQALIASADPIPGWTVEAQGAGFLDTAGALASLQSDPVLGDAQAPLAEDGVLHDISNIPEASPGQPSASFTFPGITLAPGFGKDFVFAVHDMESITVKVSNVNLGTNNPLGMNSFEVYIKGSRRTASVADYHVDSANVFGDASFTITDDKTTVTGNVKLPPCIGVVNETPPRRVLCPVPPGGRQIDFIVTRAFNIQPGFYKVRLENDFTSGDTLSADLTIEYVKARPIVSHDVSISGVLKEGQSTGFIPITVPSGTSRAVIELSWVHDWSIYPTNDLDLFIVNGTKVDTRGATLKSPERVVILNPASNLAVLVQAFTISQTQGRTAATEFFTLTIDFQ